ncbi:MAG: TetR/AcrR family transcriptional regulator [Pannonibacter indicus]
MEVFWTHGYAGADVDKLQASASIQRGSFYAAFNDKPSAFREALDRYLEKVLFPRLTMLEKPGEEALPEFLRAVGEFVSQQGIRGCLLSEAIIASPGLGPKLQGQILRIRRRLFRRLKLLSGGDSAKASFVLTCALGLHALARAGASRKQIRQAAGFAAATLSVS